jgi:hypothetical protein
MKHYKLISIDPEIRPCFVPLVSTPFPREQRIGLDRAANNLLSR